MRALLEGRWAEGEQAANEVLGFGERFHAVDALQSYGVEMLQLRNEQLRLGELTEHFELLVREATAIPGWRAALAWAHVQAGSLSISLAPRSTTFLRASSPRSRGMGTSMPACAILGPRRGELEDAGSRRRQSSRSFVRAAPYWVPARVRSFDARAGFGHTRARRASSPVQLDEAVEDFEFALERSATHACAALRRAHADPARKRPATTTGTRRRTPARELHARGAHTAHELSMARLLRDAEPRRSSS